MNTLKRFFYEPQSASTLALFRIAFGAVVLISTLGKIPIRHLFYGREALVTERTMDSFFPDPAWFYFRWMPENDPALLLFFLGLLVASVALIMGFWSRVSSVLVFLGLMVISNRNFLIENSGDDLMRINAFFLMFAPSGAAWSWDAYRRGEWGKRVLVEPWALRLIQLQLSYLYLNTAWLKLPGFSWRDGTAIYYALEYIELRRFDMSGLFRSLWIIKLSTYLVMAAEFAAGSLIWMKRFRYPVLLAALALHAGINLALQFPVFQYVMMASLLAFVPPDDLDRFIENRIRKSCSQPSAEQSAS